MMHSTNKVKDYSEEELREWIKKVFPKYKQREDDPNSFEYIFKIKGKKQEHEINIGCYTDTDIKFISVCSQRMYGNYMGCGLPSDTFEEVIENQKYAYNHIQEEVAQNQEYKQLTLW